MRSGRNVVAWSACLLLSVVSNAGEVRSELPEQLQGREALLLRYLGSDRDARLRRDDVLRSVTTYLDASGELRYVSGRRFAGIPLEADRTLSEERLVFYDRRLEDEPSLRGLEPGEVVRIREVEVDDDHVTLKIDGTGFRDDTRRDERRAELVLRFRNEPPTTSGVLERLWSVMLPAPPYSASEEAELLDAVVHSLPLKTLSDWMGRSLENAVDRVADQTSTCPGSPPKEPRPCGAASRTATACSRTVTAWRWSASTSPRSPRVSTSWRRCGPTCRWSATGPHKGREVRPPSTGAPRASCARCRAAGRRLQWPATAPCGVRVPGSRGLGSRPARDERPGAVRRGLRGPRDHNPRADPRGRASAQRPAAVSDRPALTSGACSSPRFQTAPE